MAVNYSCFLITLCLMLKNQSIPDVTYKREYYHRNGSVCVQAYYSYWRVIYTISRDHNRFNEGFFELWTSQMLYGDTCKEC
ncbi:hypothetical protein BDB01DRAFT_813407 [Pilobolus umbonatus]|nr:hypothetical protein BDB01DRAFT_813407 [Pilobolus umbonatus]